MKPMVTLLGAAMFLLSGCAGPAEQAPAPVSQAPATTSAAPARDVSGVDPCSLLTADDVRPILQNTAPDPRREDAGCAWGDGEFRGVWLTLAKAEPQDGKRAIDVGGRKGVVLDEIEYTCDVRVDVDGTAVTLRAVASDKTEWCPEAATALAAAVAKLG